MFAKINHIAILSENYALTGKFYESVFGMKTSSRVRPGRAVTVGDGYVGLNINPRQAGRPARLDHFGIEVADMETAIGRMNKKYPRVEVLKRPSNRPFAAITTHDPDGNVFDLSQKNAANRAETYAEESTTGKRFISHFGMRTMNPDAMAEFYAEMFELQPQKRAGGDKNHYLTDGHVTLVIMPWHITDYDGTGIVSPCLDYIGFTVEDLEVFKADAQRVADENTLLSPRPIGRGPEGKARLELFQRSCPLVQYPLSDPDGIFLSAGVSKN